MFPLMLIPVLILIVLPVQKERGFLLLFFPYSSVPFRVRTVEDQHPCTPVTKKRNASRKVPPIFLTLYLTSLSLLPVVVVSPGRSCLLFFLQDCPPGRVSVRVCPNYFFFFFFFFSWPPHRYGVFDERLPFSAP